MWRGLAGVEVVGQPAECEIGILSNKRLLSVQAGGEFVEGEFFGEAEPDGIGGEGVEGAEGVQRIVEGVVLLGRKGRLMVGMEEAGDGGDVVASADLTGATAIGEDLAHGAGGEVEKVLSGEDREVAEVQLQVRLVHEYGGGDGAGANLAAE